MLKFSFVFNFKYLKSGKNVRSNLQELSKESRDFYIAPMVNVLEKLRVRPWMLSFFGVVLMGVAALFFEKSSWLAEFFFGMSIVVDFLDGALARRAKKLSAKGVVTDALADTLGLFFLVVAIVLAGLVGWGWGLFYVVNYALLQFLLFTNLLKGNRIFVPARTRIGLFFILLFWMWVGVDIVMEFFAFFGVYMMFANFYLFRSFLKLKK